MRLLPGARSLAQVLLAAVGIVPLPAVAQEPAPQLPLHAFFENPDFKSPKLSEDGVWLAVLLSDGDRQVVATRAIDGGALTPLVRIDQPEMRLSWLEWANSTRILMSASVRMRVEAFLEAGYREWGWKIQDDISDGAKWLADQGVADRDRIGIYGASFGGYAALIGATKTPELYRAAAAYAAVTDIELMIDDDAKYDGGVAWHKPMVGGGRADAERLRQSSPLRLADRAGIPVLLGHGDEDDTVEVHHSRKMAAALRKAGKEVEYLEFEHEVHGFRLEANRIRWYEALIAFFEKNLAPRTVTPSNPDDSLEVRH